MNNIRSETPAQTRVIQTTIHSNRSRNPNSFHEWRHPARPCLRAVRVTQTKDEHKVLLQLENIQRKCFIELKSSCWSYSKLELQPFVQWTGRVKVSSARLEQKTPGVTNSTALIPFLTLGYRFVHNRMFLTSGRDQDKSDKAVLVQFSVVFCSDVEHAATLLHLHSGTGGPRKAELTRIELYNVKTTYFSCNN